MAFEDLEPDIYTVIVSSRQRGLRFPTPALHVLPGQTTHYWLQPPDSALYASVTLDLGMTPLFAPDGSANPEIILDTAERRILAVEHPRVAFSFLARESRVSQIIWLSQEPDTFPRQEYLRNNSP